MKQLIEDTLLALEPEIPYSKEAFQLVCGTAAQESNFGKYVRQIGGGPALGKFQMEPATFNDIIENYLNYKPELLSKLIQLSGVLRLNSDDLVINDVLACCMARIHYLRIKEPIPKTLLGQAKYWKRFYNSIRGKGTEEQYIENYLKYVLKIR